MVHADKLGENALKNAECSNAVQDAVSPERFTAGPGLLDRLYPQVRGISGATDDEAFALARCSRALQGSPVHAARRRVLVPTSQVSPSAVQRPQGSRRYGAPEPASPGKSPQCPVGQSRSDNAKIRAKAFAQSVLRGANTPWPLTLLEETTKAKPCAEAAAIAASVGGTDADISTQAPSSQVEGNPKAFGKQDTSKLSRPRSAGERPQTPPKLAKQNTSDKVEAPSPPVPNETEGHPVLEPSSRSQALPSRSQAYEKIEMVSKMVSEKPASKYKTTEPASPEMEPRVLEQDFGIENNSSASST